MGNWGSTNIGVEPTPVIIVTILIVVIMIDDCDEDDGDDSDAKPSHQDRIKRVSAACVCLLAERLEVPDMIFF